MERVIRAYMPAVRQLADWLRLTSRTKLAGRAAVGLLQISEERHELSGAAMRARAGG